MHDGRRFRVPEGKHEGVLLRDLSLDDLRDLLAGTRMASSLFQVAGAELMRRLRLVRKKRPEDGTRRRVAA